MNSLKRKKPSSRSAGKAVQTEKTATSASPRKPATPSGTLTNASNAIDALQHLIDRPYYEYNSQKDDIGCLSLSPHISLLSFPDT
jgi:hypothetical protein